MTTAQAAKHTPGPWEMFDEGDDHRFWIEGTVMSFGCESREFIAKTYALPGQREREAANARLISQAPALAEALKAISGLGGVAGEIARNALEAINDVL